MTANPLSVPELRREGFRALIERLGPTDAIRFIQQFDTGHGDFTKDRRDLFKDLTLDEIIREIEARRKSA